MTQSQLLYTPLALIKLIPALCISIGISFFSSVSYAQNEGRWYNVEVLIFKRLDSDNQTQELWRDNLSLSYPDLYQYLSAPNAAPKSHLSLLNSDAYVLNRYRNALGRNENFQILKHLAWSQQMQNEKNSPAIIISGGKQIGGRQELEGYIKIHVARFLHMTSNLWLTKDIADNTSIDEAQWPHLPERPSRSNAGRGQISNNTFEEQFGTEYNSPYPIITLQNKRRMRSNELHYIDHPSMGIMVFMTPIK